MKKAVRRYVDGWIQIRAAGASSERFLNLCGFHGVALWDIRSCEDGCRLKMKASDFKRLKPFAKKTGTRVRIERRGGFPFFLHKYRKRGILFAGAAAALACIYVFSLFIWDIQIEGNETRTDEMLLDYLEEKKVHGGMRTAEVDCADIVSELRKGFEEIIWASASLDGSRLVIQVKEAQPVKEQENPQNADGREEAERAPMDLVAEKEGKVASIVTRHGVPVVQEGSQIKPGDVLVSGNVEVKNDAGEVTGYQYQVSDADIWAYTEEVYEESIPAVRPVYKKTGKARGMVWAGWEETRITLGTVKNSFQESVSRSAERHFTLGEGFRLPFYLGYSIVEETETKETAWEKSQYRQILTEKFEFYCRNLEEKGVQILEKNVRIYKGNAVVTAKGTLSLLEPVGARQLAEKKSAAVREEDGQQEGQ